MTDLDEIKQEYEELASLPQGSGAGAKQRRGFAFERLLKKLFLLDGLEPRAGYRPDGEQIDGSLYLDGRVYLLEAKWHEDPQPASTLYQFKGKVDGKLTGTLGVFISMSGYARDAVDALTLGKDLNVILFDRKDMDAAVRGAGFKKILKFKLRKAAEEGIIFFPAEGEQVTADATRIVEFEELRYGDVVGGFPTAPLPIISDLLIICEGESDRLIIAALAERILATAGSSRSIRILAASGKMAIPRVANAAWKTLDPKSNVMIVVDSDNDLAATETMLKNGLEFQKWIAVIPNPSIETWLGLDDNTMRSQGFGRKQTEAFGVAARQLDITVLKHINKEFAKFYNAILGSQQL